LNNAPFAVEGYGLAAPFGITLILCAKAMKVGVLIAAAAAF
jgi:hypothetical protein